MHFTYAISVRPVLSSLYYRWKSKLRKNSLSKLSIDFWAELNVKKADPCRPNSQTLYFPSFKEALTTVRKKSTCSVFQPIRHCTFWWLFLNNQAEGFQFPLPLLQQLNQAIPFMRSSKQETSKSYSQLPSPTWKQQSFFVVSDPCSDYDHPSLAPKVWWTQAKLGYLGCFSSENKWNITCKWCI